MKTDKFGATVEHVQQNEINDIWAVMYPGAKEVEYIKYPRTMELTEQDVVDGFLSREYYEKYYSINKEVKTELNNKMLSD